MRRSNNRPNSSPNDPRPDNFDTLKQTITDHYDGLSKRLRDVAEYAIAHPDEMALETIAVIAGRAKVPPSSLIRFSKALGFEGFSEMQRLFRARLVAHAPTYGERIRRLHDQQASGGNAVPLSMLDDFTTASIEGLGRLREDLPIGQLERAIEIIANAPSLHVVGQRRAFPVASYLNYLLSELGCRTNLLDGAGGMFEQQCRALPKNGVLIAVSFRPYAPDVVELLEDRHEKGMSIIGITDGPLSPLARLSDVSLETVESEVLNFRPLTAAMCLSLTLAVSLGHHRAMASSNDVD